MSVAQMILSDLSLCEYEIYDRLVAERRVREEQGLLGSTLEEIIDAIDALDEAWAVQQQGEIEAENAWLRHAENASWAEYEAFDQYEQSMGLIN